MLRITPADLCLIYKTKLDVYELRGHWLPYVAKKAQPHNPTKFSLADGQGSVSAAVQEKAALGRNGMAPAQSR